MNGPILRHDEDWWVDSNNYDWMCSEGLDKFFKIPKSTVNIRLFALEREQEDTWEVAIRAYPNILVGNEVMRTTRELWEWLTKQVNSGRGHVGVELLG